MKLKSNYALTGLNGEYVAVPMNGSEGFRGIVKLNESGAEVFRALSEGLDRAQAAARLTEKYPGLNRETADKAVEIVIKKLRDAGLLEE